MVFTICVLRQKKLGAKEVFERICFGADARKKNSKIFYNEVKGKL